MLSPYLLSKYPIISDQVNRNELKLILDELEQVTANKVPGEIVEFGCYAGTTSLFIQRLLIEHGTTKQFHVYDSFEGLPEKSDSDQSATGTQFKTGELSSSKGIFIKNFKKAGLQLPHIHKGWFEDLNNNEIPDVIAFAFLDGDYYHSIMNPLKLIWEKLAPGAVIIIDDYQNEALPGAAKAVNEWIANRSVSQFRVQSSLAILRP